MKPVSTWKSLLSSLRDAVSTTRGATLAYATAPSSDEYDRVVREWRAIERATAGITTSGR